MLTQVLTDLAKQRAELEAGVFAHPPADWAAFQNRWGQWIGLSTAIEQIEATLEDADRKDETL